MRKIILADHKSCTGCMACYDTCHFNAIEIIADKYGFRYPKINKDKCKNCRKCEKVCPMCNSDSLSFKDPVACYCGKNLDCKQTKGSTSGGIAAASVQRFLKQGNIVFGASFVKGEGVKHIRISQITQGENLKGSKYVESDIKGVFDSIRTDLKESEKEILFIGTPCQVAAIESTFKTDRITSISFICGGVPSEKYLSEYIKDNNFEYSNIDNIIFRLGTTYCINIIRENEVVFSEGRTNSVYLKAFDCGYSLRPSCLNCQFCKRQRVGDLTIGDFWGIENTDLRMKNDSNVSCILVHTTKGSNLLNSLEDLKIEKASIDEIAKQNFRIDSTRSTKKLNLKIKMFHFLYPMFGFCKSIHYLNRIYSFSHKFI